MVEQYEGGFPDLFVNTLSAKILASTPPATDLYGVQVVVRRPLRVDDPNISVAVFEDNFNPTEYEIGSDTTLNANPSLMRWTVLVQVLVKAANEEDAFSTRALIINRIRRCIFSQPTINAIMVLKDESVSPAERLTKFRLHRGGFMGGLTKNNQFWALGQLELYFDTEFQ